jgi:HEAT repeat protein
MENDSMRTILRRAALGLLGLTLVAGMSDRALAQATATAPASAAAQATEQELLSKLRSETPEAEKAITCKMLAIHGSAAAVPDLALLLADERLASWARIALEAIPGPEAEAALVKAAAPLSGKLAVGTINSLGARRVAAKDLYAKKIGDADPAVAEAAAAAAGKSGTPEMAALLARALEAGKPSRDVVATACIECAERLAAAGKTAEAISLYDRVRRTDVSEQRRAEAARGLILAQGKDGIPLLVELLESPSKRLFNMGLFTARELGAGERRDPALAEDVDVTLARQLAKAAPERAVLVIEALADRNAGGAPKGLQAAMLDAAAGGAKPVRIAAVRALGRIGDAAVVSRLLQLGVGDDVELAVAARSAVAALPGDAVDREITAKLTGADPRMLSVLVSLVGDRRIAATAEIVPLADHGDAGVRGAAIKALGAVIDLPNLQVLVSRVVRPRDEAEAEAATKALKEAGVRMPDRDACADKIAAALASAGAKKTVLLETLGDVGGTRALAAVAAAAKSAAEEDQDVATRLLGKWMTADAAPVLLELAKAPGESKFKTRALKGYIRIARQFALPDADRAEMCGKALAAAWDNDDKKTVVEILARYPSQATLAVAREAAAMPGIEAEAKDAIVKIEAKLPK